MRFAFPHIWKLKMTMHANECHGVSLIKFSDSGTEMPWHNWKINEKKKCILSLIYAYEFKTMNGVWECELEPQSSYDDNISIFKKSD